MKRTHKEKGLNIFVNRFLGSIKRIQCVGQTGYIKIKKANFPDRYFRKYIKENFDKDRDGILSSDEINNITNILVVCNQNITSLQGIEHFPNLMSLTYFQTGITELDITKNTALTELLCYGAGITELDVSNNPELTELNCSNTGITELDVSKNTALTSLSCWSTGITELDVTKNTALTELWLDSTGITSLDVSQNIELDKLSCYKTEITELDISNNKKLEYLGCSCTGIEELDISQNNKLEVLDCSGTGITELDVSQNLLLKNLECGWSKITGLNVSMNTKLEHLQVLSTNLTWLHIGDNLNLSIEKSESTIDLGSIGKTFNIGEVFPGIDPSRITSINGATLDKEKGIVSGYVNGSTIKYTYDCGTSKNGTERLDVTLTL